MANLYSQPAQAQFINTYVPVPFDEIVQAGLARQGRYDVSRSAFEKSIADVEDLRAIPGSLDEQYVQQAVAHMRDVADEYAVRDYSNPEVVREIANRVRSQVDRRRLADISSSYTGYQDYNKMLAQLTAKGQATPQSLRQDFTGYSTADLGVFSGIPEAQLDWRGTTKQFFDDVEMRSKGISPVGYGMGVMRHAVDLEDLQQHAINNASIWAETPAGNQKIRELRKSGVKGTDEEIALDFLLREAPEHVKSRESQPFSIADTSKDKLTRFGYSVEKHMAAERIPEKFTNLKKAKKEIDNISNELFSLENIINTSDDIRKVENAKLELKEKQKKIEQVENAVGWAETEASEKYNDNFINLISKFDISELPHYDPGSDTSFAGSPEYNKQVSDFLKEKDEYTQELLDNYGFKSIGESINTVPTTRIKKDEVGNMYGETWNASAGENGRFLPSNFGAVVADFMIDPDVDERVVKPVGIKDPNLKKFKNASSLYVDGVSSPSDEEGSFVAVVAFDENKKGKKEKIGTYKLYLNNPSQIQTVAEAYINDGNTLDAAKWLRPDIERIVKSNTMGGITGTNSFDVPISETESIRANRLGNGNYILTIYPSHEKNLETLSSSYEKSRELSPSEISDFIYINMF